MPCCRTENSAEKRFVGKKYNVTAPGRFVNQSGCSVQKSFRISFPDKTRNRQRFFLSRFEDQRVRAFFRITEKITARQKNGNFVRFDTVIEPRRSINRRPHDRARNAFGNSSGVCRRRSDQRQCRRCPILFIGLINRCRSRRRRCVFFIFVIGFFSFLVFIASDEFRCRQTDIF